jgi:hypothetical protein
MLLKTKSMILYFPPKETLGLARRIVRGLSRSPLPPARTIAIVFLPTLLISYIAVLLSGFRQPQPQAGITIIR